MTKEYDLMIKFILIYYIIYYANIYTTIYTYDFSQILSLNHW